MESLSQIFEIFSRERRRYALYALDESDGPVAIEELAERIRRWEDNGGEVAGSAFDDVVLSLAHTHLPKAAQAEYIEYDREDGELRISGEPAEFQIVLTVSEALERPDAGRLFDPDDLTPEEFLAKFAATESTGD